MSILSKAAINDLNSSFRSLFSDIPGLAHSTPHAIGTGDAPSRKGYPNQYDKARTKVLEFHR